MAEVEFAGVKFKGGKMIAIVMALSTLVGGLYGAFEVYKDYMDMKEKIEQYTAPDLSEFDKKLAVLHEEMSSLKTEMAGVVQLEGIIKESADDARDYTKDIKRDLKEEIHHMAIQMDSVEQRGKEAFRLVRESIETNDTKVRKMVSDATDRFDKRREQTRNDMDAMETRNKSDMKTLKNTINNKIKKALENPLANMRK